MKKPEKGSGELSRIRKQPGESNAFKYQNVKASNFAGPNKTFPINTEARARNALARAHYAEHPESVKSKVYEKYPELKKRHEERHQDKRYQAYKNT